MGDKTGVSSPKVCLWFSDFLELDYKIFYNDPILIAIWLKQASIFRHYNAILTVCNALDYPDFISCAVRLLTDHKEGRLFISFVVIIEL